MSYERATYLNFRANGMWNIKADTFHRLRDLIELDLGKNKLRILESSLINECVRLETLDISDNKLTELPIHFLEKNVRLKTLLLSNNQLKTLDSKSFNGLANLSEIYARSPLFE